MVSTQMQVAVYETRPGPSAPPAVVVLVDKRIDRPSEALGILDFHSDAADEDKGFDELRMRAYEMGADAVLAAEFEHGADGWASHLSGIAVRFLDR